MDTQKSSVASTLHFQTATPSLREHPLRTADSWLAGKRIDDDVGNLWRIHDTFYDFTPFVRHHPGGRDWLEVTQGTDITEAFEAHHISTLPESLLSKYVVRPATSRRNSPFTFEEEGFYRTLKRRIRPLVAALPKSSHSTSDLYMDGLFASFLMLSLAASTLGQWWITLPAGLQLCLTTICAHNYFHRRDNWRMYYFDFCLMSSRSWRITHVLSHHIYTNTVYDYEISFVEPFLNYLPISQASCYRRYLSIIVMPFFGAFVFVGHFISTLIQVHSDGWRTLRKEILIPFTVPLLMSLTSNMDVLHTIGLWLSIIMVGSTCFGFIGLTAAHHHPHIFHDGDVPRSATLDWGVHQLDTVAGKWDTVWSHFLVLTTFGDHVLHHLFPTLDHGHLRHLERDVLEVCAAFQNDVKVFNSLKLIRGQFEQLVRTRPRHVKHR